MAESKRLIACIIFLVFTGIALKLIQLKPQKHSYPEYRLESQTAIVNKTKLSLTPSISHSHLYVDIDVESFERPDLLRINFAEHTIIHVNSQLQENQSWVIEHQDLYTRKGRLSVNLNPIATPNNLHISVYLDETQAFKWSALQTSPQMATPNN